MHLAHEEDHFGCGRDATEEIRRRRRGGDGAQQRVAEHEPESFGDVVTYLGVPGLGHLGLGLGSPDGGDGPGGDKKTERIDQYGGGTADSLDETAGDARPRDRRDLLAAG